MINIDELTLGQLRDLKTILAVESVPTTGSKQSIYDRYVGKYVICRSRNEGINAGEVIALDETGVVLKGARRLYYHKPANKEMSWYEGVALEGLSKDSRVGEPVEKVIAEDYSLTICTEVAKKSITGAKGNAQS